MQQPLLQVRDLRVTFGSGAATHAAVRGVSFSVERGRTLGIIGESGSGKSVTLRALMRLVSPRAQVTGQIVFEGRDIQGLAEEELRKLRGGEVAMVFQEPLLAMDPVYTIESQIVEVILQHDRCTKAEARTRTLDLLNRVKIPAAEHRRHALPHQLSGGMRQRAMIALALACKPSLLLADEPTTALDATVQIQVLMLLKKLQAEMNMAMVFVTHDLGVAAHVADDIAVMYQGLIVETGAAMQVLGDPQHSYTRSLLASSVEANPVGVPLPTLPELQP